MKPENATSEASVTPEGSSELLTATTECSENWLLLDRLDAQGSLDVFLPTECPEGPPLLTFAATQPFENGRMIWLEETDAFYILFNEGALPFDSRQTYITLGPFRLKPGASVDNRVGEEPPSGLVEPVGGFGHIWRGEIEGLALDVREALGWGLSPESGFDTVFQCQEQQTYSERTCYLLSSEGSVLTLSAHAIAGNIWWESGGSR